ncbi:MAG: CHRD domain-containing protein [Blastocatellales bacterium]
MKRTVGFTTSLLALLLLAFSIPASAETVTASISISPANEVPPVAGLNASGGFLVSFTANRDANGNITGGSFVFLGTVSFPGAVTIRGLHIHENVIGQNGSIRFDSGISAANPITFAGGSGLINVTGQITSADAIAALGRMLEKPSGFYLNLHTEANPSGALRGQFFRFTEALGVSVAISGANEVPPVTTNASGTGTITINPKRDKMGVVTGGEVTFTMNFKDFPANTVITGLHIHENVAGMNGSVVINTGIGGANTITIPTGAGTISRTVTLTTAAQIAALTRLLANPAGFYVNMHTSANTSGELRGQLATLAQPLAIQQVIQQTNSYFLETGSTDAQIALLIASPDLTSVLTSTVLVNGQQVAAQLDLATGAFGVVIPGALRSSAGTLFVQARSGTGLLSAPVAIVVAPAASLNNVAFATRDAAKYGSLATPEAIVAGFGTKLASQVAVATSQPLPLTLDGTSVFVNGVAAKLFFVSEGQVNYLIPATTLLGTATVVVVAKDGTVSRGQIEISSSSPGVFTANAAGTGAPAAVASANGQVFNIVMGNPDGTPREIEAGNFVSLFGTGLRFASTAMTMTIGTTNVTPLGFAAQSQFDGLDQVNLQVPQSMAGAGEVNLTFTLDGKTSNPVRLKIK